MPKETLMRNHYSFNQTHIPGIQSYPISEEKILVQCWGRDFFLHLVPLMEMTTSASIILLTYLV